MLTLTILGNNSALPAHGRNPTAQILQGDNFSALIDCGEGTQWQIKKYKIKTGKLKYIFISHLHGDHYFGLIGLLTSFSLNNRTEVLHIFCPPKLEEILNLQFTVASSHLTYEIYFHPLHGEAEIVNDGNLQVKSFKMNHRIECWGFVFREIKNVRNVLPDKTASFEIPLEFYPKLQQGHDYVTPKGTIIPNEEVTTAAEAGKSYGFCGDTLYEENIVKHISGLDMLYHETTFLKEMADKAKERFHSTTVDAGMIAKKAAVKRLIIGHFSSRYDDLENFLLETQAVFKETSLAIEGTCFKI